MATPFLAVNWTDFMNENAKSLTQQQRKLVLGVSGYHGINPLILIDKVLMEQESNPASSKISDDAFLYHLEEIANATEIFHEVIDVSSEKEKDNTATSAIWSLLEKDDAGLHDFVVKYNKLFDKTGLSHNFDDISAKEVGEKRGSGIQWPWEGRMRTGACHPSSGRGYRKSSLDPQDGSRWGGSTPWVTAAHDGWAYPTSSCGITIYSQSGFQTAYYHLENIQVRNGQYVNAGQRIAKWARTVRQALCSGGSSTGPHLHFTLRNYYGQEKSLTGQIISGYTITATSINFGYVWDCKYCNFQKGGRKFCPRDWI